MVGGPASGGNPKSATGHGIGNPHAAAPAAPPTPPPAKYVPPGARPGASAA